MGHRKHKGRYGPPPTVYFRDDLLGGLDSTRSRTVTSLGSVSVLTGFTNHPGTYNLFSGDTAGNSAFLGSQRTDVYTLDGCRLCFRASLIINGDLSTPTERFGVWAGMTDSTSTDATDGITFYYSDNANSGNWQVLVRRGGSTVGTLNTSIAPVVDQWTELKFEIPVSSTQTVYAYINDQYAGSVTPSTLFDSSHLTGCGIIMRKLVTGGISGDSTVDFYEIEIDPEG